MSDDRARRTGPALETMYQLVRWLIPTLERLPRRQKFLLGDRIQTTALAGLERLVEATFTRNRGRLLERVNVDLDKLRLLLRLAKELGYLDLGIVRKARIASRNDRPGPRATGRDPRETGRLHRPSPPNRSTVTTHACSSAGLASQFRNWSAPQAIRTAHAVRNRWSQAPVVHSPAASPSSDRFVVL